MEEFEVANIVELRRKAKKLGLSRKVVTGSRADLEAAIAAAGKNGDKPSKKKKAVKAAVNSEVPRKRGRPKGSTNKPKKAGSTTTAKRTPAESRKNSGKAKRSASTSNGDAGRLLVGSLSFTNYDEDDWNPREGSRTEYIFSTLKKYKGDVEKTFNALKDEVNDLIERTKRNGEKRTKEERLDTLRYHIHQVRWRFAVQTGQHEKATNRIEYGTGANAKPKRGRPKKGEAQVTHSAGAKKRGRPKGSTNKAKAGNIDLSPKKRGRPKGSKNKK
jgi:hypothetical protein